MKKRNALRNGVAAAALAGTILALAGCVAPKSDVDYDDDILNAIYSNDLEALADELDDDDVPARPAGRPSYLYLALLNGNLSAAELLARHQAPFSLEEAQALARRGECASFLDPLFSGKMTPAEDSVLPAREKNKVQKEEEEEEEEEEEIPTSKSSFGVESGTSQAAQPTPPPEPPAHIDNPLDYMASGEKMGVVVYAEKAGSGKLRIVGVESCAIGNSGFTYRSTGNEECHEHFRDNVHVTRASGRSAVIACDADGRRQSWRQSEYDPDNYFEKTIWLERSSEPIVALQALRNDAAGWDFSEITKASSLKTALDRLVAQGVKIRYSPNGHVYERAYPPLQDPPGKKTILNPFDYMESGEKMAVVIYTKKTEAGKLHILGVESCAIGQGGYSGCDMTYRSTGNEECHAHFRDNVHVTDAVGRGRVIDCDADGKFRSWERNYNPESQFEKVIRLNGVEAPITAVQAKRNADGGWDYVWVTHRPFLKTALEFLKESGTKRAFFVGRNGNVSEKG